VKLIVHNIYILGGEADCPEKGKYPNKKPQAFNKIEEETFWNWRFLSTWNRWSFWGLQWRHGDDGRWRYASFDSTHEWILPRVAFNDIPIHVIVFHVFHSWKSTLESVSSFNSWPRPVLMKIGEKL